MHNLSQEELDSKNLDIWEEEVKEYLKSKDCYNSNNDFKLGLLKRNLKSKECTLGEALKLFPPEETEKKLFIDFPVSPIVDKEYDADVSTKNLNLIFDPLKEQLKADGMDPEYVDSEINLLIKS